MFLNVTTVFLFYIRKSRPSTATVRKLSLLRITIHYGLAFNVYSLLYYGTQFFVICISNIQFETSWSITSKTTIVTIFYHVYSLTY